MLVCCSNDCEKCKQCGKYIYNLSDKYKNQMNTIEPLASFDWGSIGIDSSGKTHCETHTNCGFDGNYAMFEPIESELNNKRYLIVSISFRNSSSVAKEFRKYIVKNVSSMREAIDAYREEFGYTQDIFSISEIDNDIELKDLGDVIL